MPSPIQLQRLLRRKKPAPTRVLLFLAPLALFSAPAVRLQRPGRLMSVTTAADLKRAPPERGFARGCMPSGSIHRLCNAPQGEAMTSKHTQGPWSFDPEDKSIVGKDEGLSIATIVDNIDVGGDKGFHFGEESEANARLIECRAKATGGAEVLQRRSVLCDQAGWRP